MNRPDRPQRAAQFLLGLRGPGPRPSSLPHELSPQSEQEAYRVQREVARALGAHAGGWKVAMSSADRGTSAPIFDHHIYPSPARVPCWDGDSLGIEPEVAFSLRRDLPPLPDGARYQREQLIEAIDAAYAGIEIVTSRFQSHDGAPPLDRLADNISNGGLVVDAPCHDWRRLDLRTVPLHLTLQGPDGTRTEHASRGGHPLGDPLAALLWLVNDRAQGGTGMRAGELITTGSYAGLRYAPRGTRVSVEFAGLGTTTLEVS
jgi:2-keto-4-pentenoate hydratase